VRLLFAAAARSTNTRSFIEAFAARGHDIHVATLHPGTIPGATVHELGRSERGLSRWAFARAVGRLRAIHRAIRPDLTVGYYASSYGVLAALAPQPRVVVTAGGDVQRDAQDTALRRLAIPRIAAFALRRADLVLCWAPHLEDAVAALGVPRSKILTLPRGIDVDRFRAADDDARVPGRIVSTRALRSFYRPHLLLEGFLALRERGVDARLDLIGEGPDVAALARRAREAGRADEVAFAGPLEPDRLAATLRACAVYASFPPSEGVSASLLEAMASGLVPVVTDLATNRDWIEPGVNGLLVAETPTPAGIATALARALTDRELIARARVDNPRRVRERADRARNVARFEQAFLEVVRRCVG